MEPGGKIHTERDWWTKAEGMVGFLNAFQLTGDKKYIEQTLFCWRFIDKYLIDKKNGEWFWKIDKDGKVVEKKEKTGIWKCPYHNGRACFEVMEI